jgi:predicted nucleic acid-binding protein
MSRYLLDTTALIDFSKGREPARSRILQMIEAGDELGVSPVNIAEFFAGVPPSQRTVWGEFMDSLHYYEISSEAARQAGIFRHDFARKGATLSTMDALIAAVAQERQAAIVTNNVKDYPMEGIDILPL